jgi:hypothetical protein
LADSPENCFSCVARTITSPGYCLACHASTMPLARTCDTCGAYLRKKRARRAEGRPPGIYDPQFDLSSLSDGQRSEFRRHQLPAFSTDGVMILHLLTMGIFTLVYFGLMHSRLPSIKHDDFRAKKAIGFCFIPFFNLYWVFKFWLRLVDRVNFQAAIRGLAPTISKRLMLATVIVGLIPGVNLAAVVLYAICAAQIQGACNRIVPEESGQYEVLLQSV